MIRTTRRQVVAAAACVLGMALGEGCQLEGNLNRFGDQLLDQLDNTPVTLCEVSEPASPPPDLPRDDQLDQPVVPVETPPAHYPERLRRKGVEGRATVMFVIDTTGAILDPRIEYATDTSFARALLEAVESWKLEPGRNDGRPVRCYKRLTIDFALE